MAEQTKALVARLPQLRPIRPKPQAWKEIDLHDPEDTLSAQDLDRPIQQWETPSRIRLPTRENAVKTSQPYPGFTSWARLCQTSKTIILKEIAEDLRSFQAACRLLSLEPNEVEEFLGIYRHEQAQTRKWRKQLDYWRETQELPDENDDASGAGLNTISTTCVAQMCEFLSFMGLDQYSEFVSAWENKTIIWPPKINSSKFNPMKLPQYRVDFPQSRDSLGVDNFEYRKLSTDPAAPRQAEYGMMAFCAPRHVDNDNIPEVCIHYIILPSGTVVVGPTGWKVLDFGGKYRLIFPGSNEEKATNTSEFVISASSIDRTATKGSTREQQSRDEEPDINSDASPDKDENDDHHNTTFANADENMDTNSADCESLIDGFKPSFFQEAMPHHQAIEKFDEHGSFFFQSNNSRGHVPTENLAGDEYSNGRKIFIDLTNKSQVPSGESPKAHYRSHRYDPSFMCDMMKDMEQWEDPEVVLERFADIFTIGLGIKSPNAAEEHQTLPQAREEEVLWMNNNPQLRYQMRPDQATVKPVDIMVNPYQLDEEIQHSPGDADYLSNNPQPKPREKNGSDEEFSSIGELLDGVMYQFRLPYGYKVEAPTGYETSFDSHHQGPIDGDSRCGTGGQYTFILPKAFQRNPRVQDFTLPENVSFRVYIPGDFVITRDEGVLPTTLDSGCLHQFTVSNGQMDMVSEYGPHGIFHEETLPRTPIYAPQEENSDDEDITVTTDRDDEDRMDADSDHTRDDPHVHNDIMDVNSDTEGSEESEVESADSNLEQDETEDDDSNDSNIESDSESDTNLISPLREAKALLLPFKEQLEEMERNELEEDRIAAEEAEREIRRQFRREERQLKDKRRREQEAQELARDQAADGTELMGRGRRQRKRNTQDEKLGLVEYSVAEIEQASDDDWIPPRDRPRPYRRRTTRRETQDQAPAPASPPVLNPALSRQPDPSPPLKRKLPESQVAMDGGADEPQPRLRPGALISPAGTTPNNGQRRFPIGRISDPGTSADGAATGTRENPVVVGPITPPKTGGSGTRERPFMVSS